ncbi:hypothetical protein HK101_004111, partial [Irineochytrium annulatum]
MSAPPSALKKAGTMAVTVAEANARGFGTSDESRAAKDKASEKVKDILVSKKRKADDPAENANDHDAPAKSPAKSPA